MGTSYCIDTQAEVTPTALSWGVLFTMGEKAQAAAILAGLPGVRTIRGGLLGSLSWVEALLASTLG